MFDQDVTRELSSLKRRLQAQPRVYHKRFSRINILHMIWVPVSLAVEKRSVATADQAVATAVATADLVQQFCTPQPGLLGFNRIQAHNE
jgi:hypothetical protein